MTGIVGSAWFLLAVTMGAPIAQAQTPTPAQVELLKSLPAEQQRVLLDQATQGQGRPDRATDAPLSTPDTDRPNEGVPPVAGGPAVEVAPVAPLIPEAADLKPFGYDVFANVPTTFAPATDIPVPAEYVLGPGDTLGVQLIGECGGRYTLTV